MWRKALAIIGVLVFILGVMTLTVEIVQQQAQIDLQIPNRFIQLAQFRPVLIAGAGILLGPLLTIPRWLQRLRQEKKWFEKRDEPVEGPPRVPN